jgi:hypothetical protein
MAIGLWSHNARIRGKGPGNDSSDRRHTVERGAHRRHEQFVVERFAQPGNRTAGERVLAYADLVVCGNEDHRHACAGQTPLDFESAEPGHLHVENDAVGSIGRHRCENVEERVAAGKRFGGDPDGAQQSPDCPAHRFIVIYNDNEWFEFSHGA